MSSAHTPPPRQTGAAPDRTATRARDRLHDASTRLRARAGQGLRTAIERTLDPRRRALFALQQELEATRLELRVALRQSDAVASSLAAIRADLAVRTGPFLPSFTIEQVLRRHPAAASVLARHHLPGCAGCAVRFDESLAEAAEAYGLPLDALLAELNELITR